MENQQIDPKILAKLKKMLHLASHGSANEGEANNAAEIAQKIMMENNISMAQVDSHSDAPEGSARKKTVDEGNARYAYQRELMVACAEVNFVYQEVNWNYRGAYKKATGYTLIGREANVAATKILFEYLFTTVERLGQEYARSVKAVGAMTSASFSEGCAARLGERLRERHREQLREQAREARERNAAARHPAASGTALVVVMEDYAQAEKDRNEDVRLGKPDGYTAHKRLMADRGAEIRSALNDAFRPHVETVGDRDILAQTGRVAFEALVANRGWAIDDDLESRYEHELKWAISYHVDAYNEAVRWNKMTPLQRQREREKEERASERYWKSFYSRRSSTREKPSAIDQTAYSAGARAGDRVSLDAQVSREERKEIK